LAAFRQEIEQAEIAPRRFLGVGYSKSLSRSGLAAIKISYRRDVPSRPGERKIDTVRRGYQPTSAAVL